MPHPIPVFKLKTTFVLFLTVLALYACDVKKADKSSNTNTVVQLSAEKHRPEFHFTPDSMWMNDPNGLVLYKNTYHLFYQYYPDSTVWGPMHWGHATSTDMIYWQHQPIALYPDELGYIFSGSAVVDVNNTSGLGTAENPPLVAIYTYHDPVKAEQDPAHSQSQGIAYSVDEGKAWEKYENNPVLLSSGINDFRDPKVKWNEQNSEWIMTLAVKDHIRFYSSPNLLEWQLESKFGEELGAHGGVWECPDLFPLNLEDSKEEFWILIVSINPGGPNSGSGTQYFIGDFDGSTFTPMDDEIRWIDYGPDDYAGVTWSNTGSRTLFLGWMSNWKYAQVVPTERWRSAMTIPRELNLLKLQDEMVVSSTPVPEFTELDQKKYEIPEFVIDGAFNLSDEIQVKSATYDLRMELNATTDFDIVLSNDVDNQLIISYEKATNTFLIDRSKTGDTSFHYEFKEMIKVPRISTAENMDIILLVDVASVELFTDQGTTVSTVIYFPNKVLDKISFTSENVIEGSNLVLSDIL